MQSHLCVRLGSIRRRSAEFGRTLPLATLILVTVESVNEEKEIMIIILCHIIFSAIEISRNGFKGP